MCMLQASRKTFPMLPACRRLNEFHFHDKGIKIIVRLSRSDTFKTEARGNSAMTD